MKHKNIPIFIPHMGCPHQCVFCDQRTISGQRHFEPSHVAVQIEEALRTLPKGTEAEIAFFGGSFTGIDRTLMIALLETAERYVKEGAVTSIRLSTRPDYIDGEILSILSHYSVREIELGLQSMSDRVLAACGRGHTSERARRACRDVVEAGFSLTGQMMIGLPGASEEDERETARAIGSLGASAARIYPTVVFEGTPLATMMRNGRYQPLSVEEAVRRSANVLSILRDRGLRILRIGLCASEALTSPEQAIAGPAHPALGELVWGELCYRDIYSQVERNKLFGRELVVYVPQGEESRAVGQRRANVARLQRETGARVVKVKGERERHVLEVVPYVNETNGRRN